MKPVRLTLQAFGPFAGTEVIDFRDAVQTGLFGIYGKTGAGKSSIFSGMTFALFGRPAKDEQDPVSLRSDHAGADLMTEVEFLFDIGERRYLVRRRPEQVRLKQRGSGETRNVHEAWLFDATGLSLDEISGGNPGKAVAERRTGAVDAAVRDLLGYGVDQFRQIVLLPQGRFEAFLAANTKERLTILRSLFDVSLYRRLTAKMKADAEDVEREVRAERDVCVRQLGKEGFESNEALVAGIEDAEALFAETSQGEVLAAQSLGLARTELDLVRETDKLFAASEAAQAEVGRLIALGPEIDALGRRVADADRARSLLDVEGILRTAKGDLDQAGNEKASREAAAGKAAEEEQKATDVLAGENQRADEIDGLRQDLEALGRHRETIAHSAAAAEAAEARASAYQDAEKAASEARNLVDSATSDIQSMTARLQQARTNEQQRQMLTARAATLTAALKVAAAHEELARQTLDAERVAERERRSHEQTVEALEKAQAALAEAERQLSEAQAMHLAHRLEDGEPCPVCGAREHPEPATGRVENAGLDAAFREARRRCDEALEAERHTDRKRASALDILAERQGRFEALEIPEWPAHLLQDQITDCGKASDALGPVVDVPALEARLEAQQSQLRARQQAQAELQDRAAKTRTDLAVAQSRLAQMLESVPEPLRSAAALDAAAGERRRRMDQRIAALEAARQAATHAREAAIAAARDLQAAKEKLVDRQQRLDRAAEVFANRLASAGLTDAAFQALKPMFAHLEEDRRRVEQHRQQVTTARQAAASAGARIAGLARPDLTSLEAQVSVAAATHQAAIETRANAGGHRDHLCRLRDQIADAMARLDALEAGSGPLRHMAALFDGRNSQNLDLETFAIGAMFDQVLDAANMRLGPMTVQRYQLEREIEESGRGRRGLGIRVSDIYTGKSRPTSTLSGGESFIAALALALGLADVVESASGKVQLDTIFIDEGFGSLDAESGTGTLDQVLDALNTLVSHRRAVGVISHVREVQDAIPNGFLCRQEPVRQHDPCPEFFLKHAAAAGRLMPGQFLTTAQATPDVRMTLQSASASFLEFRPILAWYFGRMPGLTRFWRIITTRS
ncbi:MAG: SMC family ATPase [Rhizobium sp.]|nr:SMC family ATPase [Rhizobium sp.]